MKITPKMKSKKNECVSYEDLKPGDGFICDGALFVVSDDYDERLAMRFGTQRAYSLTECVEYEGMCAMGQTLLPVDIEIKWTKK